MWASVPQLRLQVEGCANADRGCHTAFGALLAHDGQLGVVAEVGPPLALGALAAAVLEGAVVREEVMNRLRLLLGSACDRVPEVLGGFGAAAAGFGLGFAAVVALRRT